jgi:hypothetical protein
MRGEECARGGGAAIAMLKDLQGYQYAGHTCAVEKIMFQFWREST